MPPLLQLHHRIHLNSSIFRQRGHTNRRACRVGLAEVLCHDFVHLGQVTKVHKKNIQFGDIGQGSTRSFCERAEIVENTADLLCSISPLTLEHEFTGCL